MDNIVRRRFDWYRLLPLYWIQNEPTDWEWDRLLNEALDEHGAVRGTYTAQVGPLTVWATNWPYAYGSLYEPVRYRGLPSVRTRKRLRNIPGATPGPLLTAADLLAKARGETSNG